MKPRKQPATVETAAELNVRLSTQTYLTAEEAAAYLRHSTIDAFRKWAKKALVPTCRTSSRVLFLRRDLDRAVQPAHVRGNKSA